MCPEGDPLTSGARRSVVLDGVATVAKGGAIQDGRDRRHQSVGIRSIEVQVAFPATEPVAVIVSSLRASDGPSQPVSQSMDRVAFLLGAKLSAMKIEMNDDTLFGGLGWRFHRFRPVCRSMLCGIRRCLSSSPLISSATTRLPCAEWWSVRYSASMPRAAISA